MTLYELGDVDRITADAIGEPGERVFFLQMAADARTYTITVEKEQVRLLATSILEILANVDLETGAGIDEAAMALELPLDPLWRAGRLALGYEEDRDRMTLEVEEFVRDAPEEDEPGFVGDPALEREPDRVRASATREQMLALSRHGEAVVSRGRPTCQFCGNPIDPDGHRCPAMNGHAKHD
ncbi:MAG: DUF3090 family protein [Actinomycetota bacterium]